MKAPGHVALATASFSEWGVLWRLALALGLSGAIGLERELRQKSAGLRTYAVVGVGSALFMLISQDGFFGVVNGSSIVLDPSRVAAQIVSGIGFIGAGLIFVRRDSVVKGLTTAAGVWLTAAIGAAAGAALPILALGGTLAYFLAGYVISPIAMRLPLAGASASRLQVSYEDKHGVLRRVLTVCSEHDFTVGDVNVERGAQSPESGEQRAVSVSLRLHGKGSRTDLALELEELDGVLSVSLGGEELEA